MLILDSSIVNHIEMMQYQVNRLFPLLINEIVKYHVGHPHLHQLPVLNLTGHHGIELLVIHLNLLEHIQFNRSYLDDYIHADPFSRGLLLCPRHLL